MHGDVRPVLRLPGVRRLGRRGPGGRAGAEPGPPRDQAKLADSYDVPKPAVTLDDVVAHIEHVRGIAGVDHIGIGGDYDGCPQFPDGLADVASYPALFEALAPIAAGTQRSWRSLPAATSCACSAPPTRPPPRRSVDRPDLGQRLEAGRLAGGDRTRLSAHLENPPFTFGSNLWSVGSQGRMSRGFGGVCLVSTSYCSGDAATR
ncbi:membrane dipeptidase [Kribbella sp. NPDC023972]|uniref:membrane dipeptidase n=1 Tax=Kribbella sp. NPDC023972 TaxID=3154795 RepID=UPI003400B128